jgi:hypothetical protein
MAWCSVKAQEQLYYIFSENNLYLLMVSNNRDDMQQCFKLRRSTREIGALDTVTEAILVKTVHIEEQNKEVSESM